MDIEIVGTAWYRMMPNIQLLDDIKGKDALLLQSCFPKGVIGLNNIEGIYKLSVKTYFIPIYYFILIIFR